MSDVEQIYILENEKNNDYLKNIPFIFQTIKGDINGVKRT